MLSRVVFGLMLCATTPAQALTILSEGFADVSLLPGAGWVLTNNSIPSGTTGWFQGNDGVFPAQDGATDSYVAANFENADLGGNISNWLLTPALTLSNGDEISLYTRAAGSFPDRLEVRLSTNGASTDVGATDASEESSGASGRRTDSWCRPSRTRE